jgi:hypothetical protein
VSRLSGAQDIFRQAIIQCASTNPQWARIIVLLTAFYLHLGPFSRHVIRQIDLQLDRSQDDAPRRLAAVDQSDVAITT